MGDGVYEGACSRAYYAMYHAASAALSSTDAAASASFKTHASLIAAFHRALVTPGAVDRESGRALSRALETPLLADYSGEPPQEHDARLALEQATAFLETVLPISS